MAEKGHTELLPCPFCGNAPEIFSSGEGGRGTMIECCTSGCVNPHTSYYGDGVAEKHWNTRAAVNTYPAVEGLVKALEDLVNVSRSYIAHMDADDIAALDKARSALTRFRELSGGAN